jgi:DNA-binding transcriptional LysR family regulator
MFDWNDLRYLLAVGCHGSTNAAARALGVSQSTVQRRIVELERRTGRAIVVRQATGYALTPLGRELLPLTEQVAAAVEEIERKIRGTSPDGREIIRLTCPEPVVGRLKPLIDGFHERHRGFKVEFVASDRYLDLLKGEADVALRSGDTEDALVGRTVAKSVWGLYASAAYIEKHGRPGAPADLARHAVLALDDSMADHRLMQWLKRVAPDADVVSRSTSILGLVQAAKSSIGIAPLPMSIAVEAGLAEILAPIPELARTWKLLTHPTLRDTPRVAAFFDFIAEEKTAIKGIFG